MKADSALSTLGFGVVGQMLAKDGISVSREDFLALARGSSDFKGPRWSMRPW